MELFGLKKISSSCSDLLEACPYILEQVLQKGKNSVRVIKAHAGESSETLAIKLFPKNKEGQPLKAFLKEKEAVSGLSHPHILTYHETYNDAVIEGNDGKYVEYSAIMMEYVPYGDLNALISKHCFSEKLARTLFRQMVSAINYLHNQDLVHLDLKLENLLIDPSKGIKLIDFESCQNIVKSGKVYARGTPGYRAPEVVQEQFDDPKALDIYSLGVVLFAIATGTPPYVEMQENGRWKFDRYYEALRKDTKKFWGAHQKYRNEEGKEPLSEEFKKIIESMLAEDPKRRPTIDEVQKLRWYQDEIFSDEELEVELDKFFSI